MIFEWWVSWKEDLIWMIKFEFIVNDVEYDVWWSFDLWCSVFFLFNVDVM